MTTKTEFWEIYAFRISISGKNINENTTTHSLENIKSLNHDCLNYFIMLFPRFSIYIQKKKKDLKNSLMKIVDWRSQRNFKEYSGNRVGLKWKHMFQSRKQKYGKKCKLWNWIRKN